MLSTEALTVRPWPYPISPTLLVFPVWLYGSVGRCVSFGVSLVLHPLTAVPTSLGHLGIQWWVRLPISPLAFYFTLRTLLRAASAQSGTKLTDFLLIKESDA